MRPPRPPSALALQEALRPGKAGPVGSFAPAPGGGLLGYKVLRWDPEARALVSGADARRRLPAERGAVHALPGAGLFLGASAAYVRDHYAVFDRNALATYRFDPRDLQTGRLEDREPEISVRRATLLDLDLFDEEGRPLPLPWPPGP